MGWTNIRFEDIRTLNISIRFDLIRTSNINVPNQHGMNKKLDNLISSAVDGKGWYYRKAAEA